jgi:hypothetical protein
MAQLTIASIVFDLEIGNEILQMELQDKYVGEVYEIDDNEDRDEEEDRVVDEISDECGWCILRIAFNSDKEYELQFYSVNEDGIESVTEGYFSTIKEAEERMNNIGSRWVLYPNARICLDGDIVNDYPVGGRE